MGRPSKLSLQQQEEVRLLTERGRTRRSLAIEYGVSANTISRAVGVRTGLLGPPRKRLGPCAICRTATARRIRFTLVVSLVSREAKAAKTSRGGGSIDLCESCWRSHCAGRRRRVAKADGKLAERTVDSLPRVA